MDSVQKIIRLLADGQFHSGEELGNLLGVSRAAVWKQLQKLEELGVAVRSVKGKGYCLEGGLNLLDLAAIAERLALEVQQQRIELQLHWSIDSTNGHLLQDQYQSPVVCLAEMQHAGRGRRGRSWVSPFASNIYLSLKWPFEGGAAALEGLSLAVGVALVKALEALGAKALKLKWPNDLLWQDQKLAGVLLEMSGDPSGHCFVVVGIGLNVAMPARAQDDIDQAWVDLSSVLAGPVDRNAVVAELLNTLIPLLSSYADQGFGCYQRAWEQYDAYRGQQVTISTPTQQHCGIAAGVSSQGALLLEVAGRTLEFHGGEVSLRPGQ